MPGEKTPQEAPFPPNQIVSFLACCCDRQGMRNGMNLGIPTQKKPNRMNFSRGPPFLLLSAFAPLASFEALPLGFPGRKTAAGTTCVPSSTTCCRRSRRPWRAAEWELGSSFEGTHFGLCFKGKNQGKRPHCPSVGIPKLPKGSNSLLTHIISSRSLRGCGLDTPSSVPQSEVLAAKAGSMIDLWVRSCCWCDG